MNYSKDTNLQILSYSTDCREGLDQHICTVSQFQSILKGWAKQNDQLKFLK